MAWSRDPWPSVADVCRSAATVAILGRIVTQGETADGAGLVPAPGESGRGRRFALLATGDGLARVIGFGLTIYLARVLGAGSYGVIALVGAVMLYLNTVADAGLELLGVREISDDPRGLEALVPSLLSARLVIALALWGATAAVGLVLLPQPEGAVLAACALSLFAVAAGTRWVHLGLERSGSVAAALLAGTSLSALLTPFLVRGAGDLVRWPAIQFAGESLVALLLLVTLRRAGYRLPVVLHRAVIAPVLRRSWPLVLHTLLGLIVFNADFVFLRVLRDSATVGRYAVAYALVSFFINLGQSFGYTLMPGMTRLASSAEAQRDLYGRAMAEAMLGALPVAVGGWLLGGAAITAMFGPAYAAAGAPLVLLMWAVPPAVVRSVAHTALVAHHKQRDMVRSVVWAALVNLGLNAALIPRWGMVGAAVATVITEVVRTALSVRYAADAGVPLPPLARFGRGAAACAAMLVAVALVPPGLVWLRVATGGAVYLAALALLGVLRRGPDRRFTVVI
jgi:O-antigen/teichoic acid export membrane protein